MSLLYPVLAQVLLTFVLILWTGRVRAGALRAGRAHLRDTALSSDAWPEDVRKVSNNARNQYETPVLFYVLCGAAIYLGVTGIVMTLLAWAYVATRLVHTAIHTTTNNVRRRFYTFTVGLAVLILMWIVVVVRLLGG
jgi:hypothetical protein